MTRPCRNPEVWDNKQLDYCGERSSGPWSWPWTAPPYRTQGLLRAGPLCTSGGPSRSCSTWSPPPFRFRLNQSELKSSSERVRRDCCWEERERESESQHRSRGERLRNGGSSFYLGVFWEALGQDKTLLSLWEVNHWSRFLYLNLNGSATCPFRSYKILALFEKFSISFFKKLCNLFISKSMKLILNY